MKRWLLLAGVLMLCAWAPFFYAELTNSPKEQKSRKLPDDRASDETPAIEVDRQAAATPEPDKPAPEEPAAAAPAAEKAAELPGKDIASPRSAGAMPPKEVALAKNVAESAQQDEAETTEPEAEGANDAPAPPPSASGPAPALKTAFETQARDPLWAADTEKHLRALFRGGDLPAELLQAASCRSAVCKVELRWTRERAPAYVSLYESVRKDFAAEVGVEPIGTPDEQGQEQVNLYLARKGYTVADLTK